jgi:hypothetical protein
MGVAPKAIVESFSSIGSSKLFLCYLHIVALFSVMISPGARPALPMVVAPEAIVESFLGIDSKISSPLLEPIETLLIHRGCDQHRMIRVAPKAITVFLIVDHNL